MWGRGEGQDGCAEGGGGGGGGVRALSTVVVVVVLSVLVYYLRAEKDYQSLAYPPRLAVDLDSYVDDEAHEWAR